MMLIRTDNRANYKAIFFNGKTIRQRINPNFPITTPKFAEIEDVAINTRCLANCKYCYVSALSSGKDFENIIEKANNVWGNVDQNNRPFQIAIGGAGEPTLHPEFTPFIKAVKELNIMPNYTTNGMHLSDDILSGTEEYCGGVALSYHPHIKKVFHTSIDKLTNIKTKLNIHIILGSKESLDDVKNLYKKYKNKIEYFVILPYQAVGRADKIETDLVWSEFFKFLLTLTEEEKSKFAFGALFYNWFLSNDTKLDISIYEPEIYSGYRIMDDSYNILRISSYNTEPKINI
jgi:MoaA/NifB/PqqE/SkfB family radical SAM enzyme